MKPFLNEGGLVLVTGATGYVGGRLLKSLERDGFRVRCLCRQPENLRAKVAPATEIVAGDVLDRDSLRKALSGVDTAYYLIHSMGTNEGFEELDRTAARNFSEVAREAGVKRIIYLGGLGNQSDPLSAHLRSRQEVGALLGSSGVQVIELRASVILGSGSLSFEMIRALVERLPVMITPRWVSVEAQPIAIDDVIRYLRAALHLEAAEPKVYEIGGQDRTSYGGLMRTYARCRGLKRLMIPVPFLTPRLSSLWLGFVTPLYARIGRKLIDSIRHPTVVQDPSARQDFSFQPMSVQEAMMRAIQAEDQEVAGTRWSDALAASGAVKDWAGIRFRNRIVDSRAIDVSVPAAVAFVPIEQIGGQRGWYFANFLWRLRGFIDLLMGGIGIRRGRRDPDRLQEGDVLDWWRVESIQRPRELRLRAEMKVPGRAWLHFEVEQTEQGSRIRQTAIFDPAGLFGLAYWYVLFPLHTLIFRGMLARIAERALNNKNTIKPHAIKPAGETVKPSQSL